MKKYLFNLPKLVYYLSIIPSIFFTCYFFLGIPDDAVKRFEESPIKVIGGRLFASALVIVCLILISSILDIFICLIMNNSYSLNHFFKNAKKMFIIGIIYASFLLLLEYIVDGMIV